MDTYKLLEKISAELESGAASFPSNVQLARKLQLALDDPDCHVGTATRLIKAEPLLASKVVALANSAAFNASGRPITDINTAVSRLGFRNVHTLVSSVIARQLGVASSPKGARMAAQLWEHTAHVAALAFVIAKRVTHQDPETAMFAGIVHEIGGFYIIARAADYPELLDEDFSTWSDNGEAEVGRVVFRALEIPDSITAAAETCWSGFLALPPSTLGDTLLLADELAVVESPLRDMRGVPREGRAASLDMSIGEETLVELLKEAAVEVDSLTAALKL